MFSYFAIRYTTVLNYFGTSQWSSTFEVDCIYYWTSHWSRRHQWKLLQKTGKTITFKKARRNHAGKFTLNISILRVKPPSWLSVRTYVGVKPVRLAKYCRCWHDFYYSRGTKTLRCPNRTYLRRNLSAVAVTRLFSR